MSATSQGWLSPLLAHDPDRIGPYRLAGRLGAGGMGAVFAGADDTGRRAAVKVIHRQLAHDPEFRARFAREISVLHRVNGLCTVRVLDADAEAEQPWLATEYVPGPTLAQRVEQNGPLSEQEIVGLAGGLGEALRAMHTVGVVHRDLKPSNVILSPTGPRLIDMGIARAMDETSVTRTGVLVGSPGWISPEEYRGSDVGPAADVYGWALLVLFAATGRPPFGTGRPEVLAARILTETPDASAVPDGLRHLVRQALAKDPAARPSADRIIEAAAHIWRQSDEDTATAVEEVTRFLDQTWVMPLDEEPQWSFRESLSRQRRITPLVVAGSALAAVAVAVATVDFVLNLPRAGSVNVSPPSSGPAVSSPPEHHTPPTAGSPSPASAAQTSQPDSASVTPTGRRAEVGPGHSFVLPTRWKTFVYGGASGGTMCVTPKSQEDCYRAVTIYPWFEIDDLNLDDARQRFSCDDGDAADGSIAERELRKVGTAEAQYRKYLLFCDGEESGTAYSWWIPDQKLLIEAVDIPNAYLPDLNSIVATFRLKKGT
ncbi:serine/threonine protein kinase [Nonomuraea harbinensis]|uniref:Serine/threonine protein kinase n=1 Tax=Nonomuraea harbinensis TaxID=1286938 RepID=A0ABW1C8G0_9ACTN|nr:serine/threonine-protein kinase [Nonomuraea harbinensis]